MNDCDNFFAMAIKTLQVIIIYCIIGYPLLMILGIWYLVWVIHVPLIIQWCLWTVWILQFVGYQAYLAFLDYTGLLKRLSE
jgi:hypothetical protein